MPRAAANLALWEFDELFRNYFQARYRTAASAESALCGTALREEAIEVAGLSRAPESLAGRARLLEQCDVLLMEVKSAEAGRAHGVPSVT